MNASETSASPPAAWDNVIAACDDAGIDIHTDRQAWVELTVPCLPDRISLIETILETLATGLDEATSGHLALALREMLNNAIEHGCRLDGSKRIEVTCVRLRRCILCRIKDPGPGFDPAILDHAAGANPDGDPFRHLFIRDERGLRPGGYGILLANRLVDELVYNDLHNEVLIIKYLQAPD